MLFSIQGTRGLAMLDMNNSVDGALMEAVWHGAEGYHFMMLAQRQLHNGYIDNAMKTSYRLRDYEDVLNVEALYGILALASASNRAFATCSKAFIKLESLTKVNRMKHVFISKNRNGCTESSLFDHTSKNSYL